MTVRLCSRLVLPLNSRTTLLEFNTYPSISHPAFSMPLFARLPARIFPRRILPAYRSRNISASQSRHFSATRPRSTFLDATTQALTTFHATSGLSWAALIPLAAISIRVVLTLPLTIYARKVTAKIIRLVPLIDANTLHRAASSASAA